MVNLICLIKGHKWVKGHNGPYCDWIKCERCGDFRTREGILRI